MPDETNLYMLVQGEVWISGHC